MKGEISFDDMRQEALCYIQKYDQIDKKIYANEISCSCVKLMIYVKMLNLLVINIFLRASRENAFYLRSKGEESLELSFWHDDVLNGLIN